MQKRPNQSVTQWQARAGDALVWASWDDEYIAYHRPSGKTHFLNASSHYLIVELLSSSQDIDTITATFSVPDAEQPSMYDRTRLEVQAMLDHFEQLGLIEQA